MMVNDSVTAYAYLKLHVKSPDGLYGSCGAAVRAALWNTIPEIQRRIYGQNGSETRSLTKRMAARYNVAVDAAWAGAAFGLALQESEKEGAA